MSDQHKQNNQDNSNDMTKKCKQLNPVEDRTLRGVPSVFPRGLPAPMGMGA